MARYATARNRPRPSRPRRAPAAVPRGRKIRYAVVGLGHIAQNAVLPAFRHARSTSVLAALVSEDARKRKELSKRYRVPAYSYDEYDLCLRSGDVDAVYVAEPNSLHRDFTVDAARAGAHVLCEKPLATTERECREMIAACSEAGVKLMVAYRLHFEAATLEAIRIARSGALGELRFFDSVFSMQVKEGNIRLRRDLGGGPLWDIGVYCINAARALFDDDPVEVLAASERGGDPRFTEVDEMTSAVLRFPGRRLAAFTCSFGAADTSSYRIVGTEGSIRVEPAYEYAEGLVLHVTKGDTTRVRRFGKRDQFAPELEHFSRAILADDEPEPSGREGLIDVAVVRGILAAASRGGTVRLGPFAKDRRPSPRQRIDRPPVRKPRLVRVESASE
jgi:glucose-fructose oxidoreductase